MHENDKAENPDNACPTRKPTRLPHYDYSQNGCYFVTICTASKKPLFGRYLVGALHEAPAVKMPRNRFIALNRRGVITKKILYSLPKRFLQIQIENAIIMPNHIHLLLTIDWENGKWERAQRASAPTTQFVGAGNRIFQGKHKQRTAQNRAEFAGVATRVLRTHHSQRNGISARVGIYRIQRVKGIRKKQYDRRSIKTERT